jgi:glutamyl-Q tRNA(Asp) synthetase
MRSGARVFRFAPSPNGFLHLGHAASALLNADLARECSGRFLLRIEDIDRARAKPEFEAAIYEDLSWLGLNWETPVRRQSEHFDDYAAALSRLDALGLLYPCSCTRSDVAKAAAARADWPRDPDGAPQYHGACRAAPRGGTLDVLRRGGIALRLDMRAALARAGGEIDWFEHSAGRVALDPARWGDVVLARKDTPASYHLCVVVDDALQGVTDIVRGRDLYAATALHRLLQRLLDLPEPRWRHHPLLRDSAGDKLAKSRASTPLRALRAAGASPEDIRAAARAGLREGA